MKQAEIKFSLSGHIHESGGRGVTSYGEAVEAGEWSDDLRLNPGAAHPTGYLSQEHHEAMASILTIEEGKAKYQLVIRKPKKD